MNHIPKGLHPRDAIDHMIARGIRTVEYRPAVSDHWVPYDVTARIDTYDVLRFSDGSMYSYAAGHLPPVILHRHTNINV